MHEDRGYRLYQTLVKLVPAISLLVLYFSGLSLLGVSLSLPFAFLWLMWTLMGIKSEHEKLNENLKRYTPQIPQE